MPEAQRAVEILSLADREDASRRDDPVVANDYASVMERCFREEKS
jgi:hypothetical protein